jgi:molybdopterin synthase catalytic subunit
MIRVIHDRIDVAAVRAAVADPGCGAVLVFEGTARDHFEGRGVTRLHYEAHVPMAEAELRAIAEEIGAQWPGARVAMVHRLGEVAIGEPSVVVAVATPHRAACYEASRYALEQLKVRVPVWKQEIYADGSEWKANSPA